MAAVSLQPPKFPRKVANVAALEAHISRMVESNNPPGISITIVRDNQIVYSYSVGSLDSSHATGVTSSTVYHWWSMTKVVTAVGIMQLHEQGRLDIDMPVVQVLPWFTLQDGEADLGAITIRQLLRHTSGLPDTMPAMIGWVHYGDEIYNQSDYLRRIIPEYRRLLFEPDQKTAYSNFGYLVLGAIIGAVSGDSYENYISDHILKPIGMESTNFLYTPEMSMYEAVGSHPLLSIYTPLLPFLLDMKALVSERRGVYLWFERLYHDVSPSSGLIGSSDDAAKFMLAYLDGALLLSEESKAIMQPSGLRPTERPLGWSEFDLGERMWLQHRGGGPGFAAIMRVYPRESLGIVVMANGTQLPAEQIVDVLANLYMDLEE